MVRDLVIPHERGLCRVLLLTHAEKLLIVVYRCSVV